MEQKHRNLTGRNVQEKVSFYARRNYTQLQAACTRKDKKLPVLHVRHTTEYSSILGKIVMQR